MEKFFKKEQIYFGHPVFVGCLKKKDGNVQEVAGMMSKGC